MGVGSGNNLWVSCVCVFDPWKHWILKEKIHQAVHKKKSVSCPAGGRNYGQSGGCNFFFFPPPFFSLI